MTELLFTCAICERDVTDYRWLYALPHNPLAPLCRFCEGHYRDRLPTAGSFLDRRKAGQIAALANALHGAASIMDWNRRHG